MAGTVADVLRIAESQVGYSRWTDEEPGTRYGRWYASVTGSPYFGMNGVDYCAMAVSWVLNVAQVSCESFPRADAIDRGDHLNRQVEPADLQPGDVVGFDWATNGKDGKGDHVGIFKAWLDKGWRFECYEGNVDGGRYEKMVRYVSDVTIGLRPYYEGSASPKSQAGLLDVDGIAGPKTVMRLQVRYGTTEDGVISRQRYGEDRYRPNVWAVDHANVGSSELVLAMQRDLKARGLYEGSMDGLWGKMLSVALQKRLTQVGHPVAADGIFGPHSVKALQEALNDGSL